MSAYIKRTDSQNKSMQILTRFMQLEQLLLNTVTDEPQTINLKELNEQAEQQKNQGCINKGIEDRSFLLDDSRILSRKIAAQGTTAIRAVKKASAAADALSLNTFNRLFLRDNRNRAGHSAFHHMIRDILIAHIRKELLV